MSYQKMTNEQILHARVVELEAKLKEMTLCYQLAVMAGVREQSEVKRLREELITTRGGLVADLVMACKQPTELNKEDKDECI